MKLLKGLEQVVHNVLLVNFLQNAGLDDPVQVCLPALKEQADVTLILQLRAFNHLQKLPTNAKGAT